MNNQEVQFYKDNGFFILKNAISNDEIKTIHKDIHTVVKQQLALLKQQPELETSIKAIFSDLKKLHALSLDKYLSSLRLCAKLTSIFQAVLNPKLLSVSKTLGIDLPIFQTQPVFHVMAEQLMIKDGYFGVGAHQDWPALQSGLDTFTTWVPLVPVKEGKYTLEIIPKSHLLGFCESQETQNIHEISPEVYKDLPYIKVEMEPGDVLIFSVFLIHRSEMTGNSDSFRMAYSMRYENASNDNFIRRNYPGAQKRVVERALDPSDIPLNVEVQKTFK